MCFVDASEAGFDSMSTHVMRARCIPMILIYFFLFLLYLLLVKFIKLF